MFVGPCLRQLPDLARANLLVVPMLAVRHARAFLARAMRRLSVRDVESAADRRVKRRALLVCSQFLLRFSRLRFSCPPSATA